MTFGLVLMALRRIREFLSELPYTDVNSVRNHLAEESVIPFRGDRGDSTWKNRFRDSSSIMTQRKLADGKTPSAPWVG